MLMFQAVFYIPSLEILYPPINSNSLVHQDTGLPRCCGECFSALIEEGRSTQNGYKLKLVSHTEEEFTWTWDE